MTTYIMHSVMDRQFAFRIATFRSNDILIGLGCAIEVLNLSMGQDSATLVAQYDSFVAAIGPATNGVKISVSGDIV